MPGAKGPARELRDRWMERVNEDPGALIARGKYEVGRARMLEGAAKQVPLLPDRAAAGSEGYLPTVAGTLINLPYGSSPPRSALS